jgi:hypothetical protein
MNFSPDPVTDTDQEGTTSGDDPIEDLITVSGSPAEARAEEEDRKMPKAAKKAAASPKKGKKKGEKATKVITTKAEVKKMVDDHIKSKFRGSKSSKKK